MVHAPHAEGFLAGDPAVASVPPLHPPFSVREATAPELIAELRLLETTLRLTRAFPPESRSVAILNPQLLDLIARQRRILREMKRRRALAHCSGAIGRIS